MMPLAWPSFERTFAVTHICCVHRVCIREQGRRNLNLFFFDDTLREVAAGHGRFTDKPIAFKTRTGSDLLIGPYTSLSVLAHLPNLVGDGTIEDPHVISMARTGGLINTAQ